MHSWLIKHGKEKYIDFKREQIQQLKEYFDSLDFNLGGSIGVDELEDPLIAMGIVDNREQVQKLVTAVDEDGSGEIEFEEFLSIIKGTSGQDENSKAIKDFF